MRGEEKKETSRERKKERRKEGRERERERERDSGAWRCVYKVTRLPFPSSR